MTQKTNRRPFIAGNWKMFKTPSETTDYINSFKSLLSPELEVDITLAPPFTALEAAVGAASGTPIAIAAQNVFWETEGAFTGEVSALMLKSMNVSQVIIGHSERRQLFGETDETVNRRLHAALAAGLLPIFCVGETLDERESGQTFQVLARQIQNGLANIDPLRIEGMTVAYEPVWAIGTGRTATPAIAQEAHAFIRQLLASIYNKEVANLVRVLYGGSVKPENAAELMNQPDIDGALVGGASLKPDVFIRIVNQSAA